jgi:hypothetical protein
MSVLQESGDSTQHITSVKPVNDKDRLDTDTLSQHRSVSTWRHSLSQHRSVSTWTPFPNTEVSVLGRIPFPNTEVSVLGRILFPNTEVSVPEISTFITIQKEILYSYRRRQI